MSHRPNISPPKNARIPVEDLYRRCKLYRHSWDPIGNAVSLIRSGKRVPAGDEDLQRCTRCHTHRLAVIDHRTGELLGGYKYLWPEGYLETTRGLSGNDLRMDLVIRAKRQRRADAKSKSA